MRNTRKPIVALLAVALVAALGAGATVAWLSDKTESVTNTFTVGKVDITLKESPIKYGTLDAKGNPTYGTPAENVSNAYKLIPGETYTKDPTVAVAADSEDCYLFVKFEESPEALTYLTYASTLTSANSWTQGSGTIPSNVWYRVVKHDDAQKSWELLVDNKIAVKDTVTKADMAAAANVKLVYTAYAIQMDNIADAATAWSRVSGS